MKTDQVTLEFKDGYIGKMSTPTGAIAIGKQENGMLPYHLLYGALASCFYATFLGVVDKMKCSFDEAKIEVNGNKREEVPTTLENVYVVLTVVNPSDQDKITKAAELGTKYCSVYETISNVATMNLEVRFEILK